MTNIFPLHFWTDNIQNNTIQTKSTIIEIPSFIANEQPTFSKQTVTDILFLNDNEKYISITDVSLKTTNTTPPKYYPYYIETTNIGWNKYGRIDNINRQYLNIFNSGKCKIIIQINFEPVYTIYDFNETSYTQNAYCNISLNTTIYDIGPILQYWNRNYN